MAGVESELYLKHTDSQISPEIVAESVKGFQQVVEEVINTATEDDDQMSSYLKTSLTELNRRHTVLADQHRSLKEKANNDEMKAKETSEASLKRLSDLRQVAGSLNEKITILEDENTKLKLQVPESELDVHESQSDPSQQDTESPELVSANNLILQLARELATQESKVRMLEKDVNELLLLVENIGYRVKFMEQELKDSKKKLVISENVISQMKKDQVEQQVLDSLYEKIESNSKTVNELQQRMATEMSIHEDQTTKVNRKIDEYKGLISEMKSMNKLKEDIWNDDVGKLQLKIESRCKSFSDLIVRLNALKVEKKGLSAQLETLEKENDSKVDLIQELKTRLDSLQAVHGEVSSLVNDVDKVNNELTLKAAELKEKLKDSAKLFQKEKK